MFFNAVAGHVLRPIKFHGESASRAKEPRQNYRVNREAAVETRIHLRGFFVPPRIRRAVMKRYRDVPLLVTNGHDSVPEADAWAVNNRRRVRQSHCFLLSYNVNVQVEYSRQYPVWQVPADRASSAAFFGFKKEFIELVCAVNAPAFHLLHGFVPSFQPGKI